jgi:hypothetical protein
MDYSATVWDPYLQKDIEYNRQSSANRRTWNVTHFGRSFMRHRKSKGPRTVPCGTPESTVHADENSPSTTTLWSRY